MKNWQQSMSNLLPTPVPYSTENGKCTFSFWLWKKEVLRYGELKKALGKVTHKMLSQQLKEMEADGIIYRKEYPQVPPKVEYGLTTLGKSLMPILQQVCTWGQDHYQR